MKKFLLFTLALFIGASTFAQSYQVKLEPNQKKIGETPAIGIEPLKGQSIVGAHTATPAIPAPTRDVDIVNIIEIGTSANAYGYGYNGGQKSLVWSEPGLNVVTNFHRMGGTLDPDGYSGDMGYDISFDGGLTWTNQIEVYVATENSGGTYFTDAARYPNHGVYNPTDDIADAAVVFFAPNLDGSNSDDPSSGWGGYSYGTADISDPSVTTKNLLSTHDDYYQYIPEGYDLTSQGLSICVDKNVDWTSGSAEYQGSMITTQGYWDEDAADFVYTQSMLDLDIDYPWFHQVAFAPDGMTGYIVALGNNGETWSVAGMPSIYPLVFKTTDGGENWGDPIAIQIDGPDGLGGIVDHLLTDEQIGEIYEAPVPARDEIPYLVVSDFDCAVTADGNLHIVGLFAAAGEAEEDAISFYVTNGLAAIVDLFTNDGGTTWYAEEMGRIQTWEGVFGDLNEQNRTQVTLNQAANKVFVSWLDTDIEDHEDNDKPNIWCRGFEPSSYMKTADADGADLPSNVTKFSAGMWQSYFGTVAKTTIETTAGVYTMPYVFENMDPADPAAPVQFMYITDFSFTDADFTVLGVEDQIKAVNNISSVSQNFPNPFNNETYVTVNLEEGSSLSLDVFTLTGQMVSSKQYGYKSNGSHTLTINGADLTAGVYFYTITAGENKVTHKMIVE